MNRAVAAILALVALTLALIIARQRRQTSTETALSQLEQSAVNSRETAAVIVANTKAKEASTRAKIRQNTALLTDDELCTALTEMLRVYRDTAH